MAPPLVGDAAADAEDAKNTVDASTVEGAVVQHALAQPKRRQRSRTHKRVLRGVDYLDVTLILQRVTSVSSDP